MADYTSTPFSASETVSSNGSGKYFYVSNEYTFDKINAKCPAPAGHKLVSVIMNFTVKRLTSMSSSQSGDFKIEFSNTSSQYKTNAQGALSSGVKTIFGSVSIKNNTSYSNSVELTDYCDPITGKISYSGATNIRFFHQYPYTWGSDFRAEATITWNYDKISYTATFKDWDEAVLKTETVKYGNTPTAPSNPTREADEQYTYSFSGWSPAVGAITGNTIYTAQYTATKRKYSVEITYDENECTVTGAVSDSYEYGTKLTLTANPKTGYTFQGWWFAYWHDTSVNPTDNPITFTVLGEECVNARMVEIPKYQITIGSSDGGIVIGAASGVYAEGTKLTLTAIANTGYEFVGWSDGSASDTLTVTVTEEATYSAIFEPILYTVRWFNEDGTLIEMDSTEYGKIPSYDGATPVKPDTAQYEYTFAGWSIDDKAPVTGDTDFYATYTETLRTYTVTWKNADGTVLETDEKVPYGDMPEYNGVTPTMPPTAQFTFEFANEWDTAVTEVTKDVVYTALYNKTVNKYYVEILNNSESVASVIGAETGIYEYGTQLTLTAITKDGVELCVWREVDPDEGEVIRNLTDNPVTITVERDTYIIALFCAKGGMQIGTSYVLNLYYEEQTQTVYFCIDEEIEIEPTGADTINGLHFVVTTYEKLCNGGYDIPENLRLITGVQVGTTYVYFY